MRWPLDSFTVTQGFSAGHQGVDLAAPDGTPIKAPDGGVVIAINSAWKPGGYFGGNYVKVRGDEGYTFYMGHMSKTNTKLNARVSEGQVIGYVGQTGEATGPHIHFETSKRGVMYDPRKVIKEEPMSEAERKVYNKGVVIQGIKPLSEGNIVFEFTDAGNQWKLDTVVAGKAESSAKVKKGHQITCQSYVDLAYRGKKMRYYVTETDLGCGRLYGVNKLDVKIIKKYK